MGNRVISNKQIAFVLLVFILLTAVFTFPLILNMGSYIPGFHSSDEPYGALWSFWWTGYSHVNHLDPTKVDMIAAPFGRIIEPGYALWNLISKGLILMGGVVAAYNIQVLLSFLLTGIISFLLARRILNSSICALFSAVIFTFCPYHFVRSWQHLGLAHIQWMPLYLLALFLLNDNLRIRNVVLAAISFALVMSFDLYYAYFMFIATVAFVLYCFLNKAEPSQTLKFIKLLLIMGIFVLLLESVDLYHIFKFMSGLDRAHAAKGAFGYIRPFEALFAQSARPLSYLMPASTHPVFGKFTEQFMGSSFYGTSFTEHTLYLGWVPLCLAFLAFKKWRLRRKELRVTSYELPVTEKENFYIGFFLFLAVVAWLFSQPPWWQIGPIKIPMPSLLMYKVLPMFRAYCRFAVLVMLAVAILAGAGLRAIFDKLKSQNVKITVTILFCGLVLFEFWNYPPFKVIDVSKVPDIYYWLKAEPKEVVLAEYPLDTNGSNELYKFYQSVHGKKIINGTVPGIYANKVAQIIVKLSDLKTAGILKWMGVRYVLVHNDNYLSTDLTADKEELTNIRRNPGLKFIKAFPSQECLQKDIMCIQKTGPIDVYEVTALPVEPEIKCGIF